MNCTQQPCWRG